ncbi:hypothetical protein NQZ79_g7642 [Umbelopsis isabellina]|nr:hypothetical protein NQZ79_g7642 [Umbelopsis isabellina]
MSLHAAIPGESIKAFATILNTLGAIGDELHFEAQRGQLVLVLVNSSITTLAKVHISHRFFEKYRAQDERNRPLDTVLFCQVAIKGFAALFKKQTKILDSIEINLEGASSIAHSALDVFQPCRISVKRNGPLGHSGFSRTKSMPFAQSHPPHIDYSKDTASRFVIQAKHLREYLNYFNSKVEEITLVCSRYNMKLRNAGLSVTTMGSSTDSRPFQIEVSLNMDQFHMYEICSDSMMTLSMKDLKTIVAYAENLGENVSAYFNDAGNPIIFSVQYTGNTIFDMVLLTRCVPEVQSSRSVQDEASVTRSSINISQTSGRSAIYPSSARPRAQERTTLPPPQQPPSTQPQDEPLFLPGILRRDRNDSITGISMLPLQGETSSNSDGSNSRRNGEQTMFAFGSPHESDPGPAKRRRQMRPTINDRGSGSDTDDGSSPSQSRQDPMMLSS